MANYGTNSRASEFARIQQDMLYRNAQAKAEQRRALDAANAASASAAAQGIERGAGAVFKAVMAKEQQGREDKLLGDEMEMKTGFRSVDDFKAKNPGESFRNYLDESRRRSAVADAEAELPIQEKLYAARENAQTQGAINLATAERAMKPLPIDPALMQFKDALPGPERTRFDALLAKRAELSQAALAGGNGELSPGAAAYLLTQVDSDIAGFATALRTKQAEQIPFADTVKKNSFFDAQTGLSYFKDPTNGETKINKVDTDKSAEKMKFPTYTSAFNKTLEAEMGRIQQGLAPDVQAAMVEQAQTRAFEAAQKSLRKNPLGFWVDPATGESPYMDQLKLKAEVFKDLTGTLNVEGMTPSVPEAIADTDLFLSGQPGDAGASVAKPKKGGFDVKNMSLAEIDALPILPQDKLPLKIESLSRKGKNLTPAEQKQLSSLLIEQAAKNGY